MSVVSKNPFDLLGDDGEESPAPAAAPKKAAPAAKTETPAAPARSVPGAQPRGGSGARGRGSYPSRGGRGGDRTVTNDIPRNTGPTSGDGVAEGFETPGGFDGERVASSKRYHRGPDAHTKGPRGNRPIKNQTSGGHTSRGGDHIGRPRAPQGGGERRQFERRSGTVGDSQKKVDQGWGPNEGTAELTAEVEGEQDAQKEETAAETAAVEDAEAPAPVEAAPAEPEEPEEVTKSYDQYLAEKAAAALEFGKKEARKVTEDAVEGTAFVREAINDFFGGKEKTAKTKTAAPKKEKVYIEFDGQFATPPGGGSRGGRDGDRGGRGGRGRGGERGGRGFGGGRGRGAPRGARGGFGGSSQNAGINASDEKAFPALGA